MFWSIKGVKIGTQCSGNLTRILTRILVILLVKPPSSLKYFVYEDATFAGHLMWEEYSDIFCFLFYDLLASTSAIWLKVSLSSSSSPVSLDSGSAFSILFSQFMCSHFFK